MKTTDLAITGSSRCIALNWERLLNFYVSDYEAWNSNVNHIVSWYKIVLDVSVSESAHSKTFYLYRL